MSSPIYHSHSIGKKSGSGLLLGELPAVVGGEVVEVVQLVLLLPEVLEGLLPPAFVPLLVEVAGQRENHRPLDREVEQPDALVIPLDPEFAGELPARTVVLAVGVGTEVALCDPGAVSNRLDLAGFDQDIVDLAHELPQAFDLRAVAHPLHLVPCPPVVTLRQEVLHFQGVALVHEGAVVLTEIVILPLLLGDLVRNRDEEGEEVGGLLQLGDELADELFRVFRFEAALDHRDQGNPLLDQELDRPPAVVQVGDRSERFRVGDQGIAESNPRRLFRVSIAELAQAFFIEITDPNLFFVHDFLLSQKVTI